MKLTCVPLPLTFLFSIRKALAVSFVNEWSSRACLVRRWINIVSLADMRMWANEAQGCAEHSHQEQTVHPNRGQSKCVAQRSFYGEDTCTSDKGAGGLIKCNFKTFWPIFENTCLHHKALQKSWSIICVKKYISKYFGILRHMWVLKHILKF